MQKILCSTIILLFVITCNAQWTQLSDAPFEAHHSNGFGIDGKGYIIKGLPDQSGNGLQNQLWEYEPSNDTWTLLGNVDGPSRTFSIGEEHEGKFYFGFGDGLNDLWVFDPVDKSFLELPTCPCAPRAHPAFVAHKGKIYMGSGSGANSDLRDWWVYDIEDQIWAQKTNIPGPNRHHPFQFGIGDEIFVGGGHQANWSKFNIITEAWSSMDAFPEGRVAGTQFSYNGKGFALSGDTFEHNALANNQFLMYIPETDEWFTLPFEDHMHRWACSSFIIDDELYYFGGVTYVGNDDSDMWKFDLSTTECLAPSNSLAVSITETSAGIFFNGAPTGTVDTLQFREMGVESWTSVLAPTAVQTIDGLNPCTTYEFRLSVACGEENSTYSAIETFSTQGCGACVDFAYCSVESQHSAFTCFVDKVKINDYESTSGDNSGYGEFVGPSVIEIMLGQTFDLEVTPGYYGSNDDGNLKVWIDFNGDGEFGSEEVIVDEEITDVYTNTIDIPTDAVPGSSRIRIIFDIFNINGACDGSQFSDGEAEDYCIQIIDDSSSSSDLISTNSTIKYYPNPVSDVLYIEHEAEIDHIQFFDIAGQSVKSHSQGLDASYIKVPTHDLAPGVYIITGRNNKGKVVFSEKLYKQ